MVDWEEFKEYFKGEYVNSDFANWFEGASSFRSTNNGLEFTHRVLKADHTDLKLNPLQHIVCNLELGKIKTELFFLKFRNFVLYKQENIFVII